MSALVSVPLWGFLISNYFNEQFKKILSENVSVPLWGFLISNTQLYNHDGGSLSVSVPLWGFLISNMRFENLFNTMHCFRPLMGFLNFKSRPCRISNHAPSRSVLRGKNKNGTLYKNIHSNIQCKRPIFKVRGKIFDKTIKFSFIIPQTFP